MKTISKIIISITVLLSLTGCLYGQCMNGPCAFERAEIIANIKPYGAHWIKEGMTREQRRQDSWACGAYNNVYSADHVVFSKEQRSAARLPSDQNDYGPDGRLTKQWVACMRSKDYVYLHQCDASCLYP
jgi:hypothetical protein